MKGQLERRLDELRSEFKSGQKLLGELEDKQANVKSTLLRISGAIQVLEEELTRATSAGSEGTSMETDHAAAFAEFSAAEGTRRLG